jgi:E3 ubiquitin-protein ligase TM129
MWTPKNFSIILGFTIEKLFSSYLGSESILFIQYHINRSCFTLLIHSILPPLYFICHFLYFGHISSSSSPILSHVWTTLVILSAILPPFVIALIFYYQRNNWENHPIARILQNYSNTPRSWTVVAGEVNNEYRRQEKVVKKNSAISKLIITENWIIQTSLYFVNFAHQSDTALIAINSDTHNISIQDTHEQAQFVNIEVKPTRRGVKSFKIRINSTDFRDIQDRINRPITVLSSVRFHTTTIERFVDVFNEEIKNNPKYPRNSRGSSDLCFACMAIIPNVKINKTCLDQLGGNNCTNCFCRPMW